MVSMLFMTRDGGVARKARANASAFTVTVAQTDQGIVEDARARILVGHGGRASVSLAMSRPVSVQPSRTAFTKRERPKRVFGKANTFGVLVGAIDVHDS